MEHLLVTDEGPVTRITLNRPERRNALSLPLMEELTKALLAVAGDVVVLAGAGPVFSAGHDLTELATCDTAKATEVFGACTALMQTVQSIGQPVIAEVNGVATAAGCQLVAACDLAVAEEGARFATPGVRIGLFCSTPMVPLSRAIGPKRAMKMLLTGDLVDARTALDWGLVNDVVPASELSATVDALARRIAEASPAVIAVGKRTFWQQLGLDQAAAYDVAAHTMVANATIPDAREGIGAFLEKRAPTWEGRS
ncbi:MAG: enoyl-CoA hydratase [Acidimicrobiia bacterium]|nr:enoyl-CoA hydratase [Acidimicrobiia bacterium]